MRDAPYFVGCIAKWPYSLTLSSKNFYSQSFNASSTILEDLWIIDSCSTDHATFLTPHFLSYHFTLGTCHVIVADGSRASVAGSGTIALHPSLHLHDVLHVLQISHNLIFVHKFIKDKICALTFFHSHCVFQDLTMGSTIRVAKE